MGPKYHQKCPYKREAVGDEKRGGEDNVKTEQKEICPQAKECRQTPKAGRDKGWILSQSLRKEDGPADTLISAFWPPEL